MVVAYLAGLLVYARRHARRFVFIRDGGVRGEGYKDPFRRAKRSLLLMHVDDDTPSAELQELYRTLLDRGVRMRRTVVVRREGNPEGYAWIAAFGNHPNLQQRVLPPEVASVMPLSFVIVDESLVILSVPGYAAIDTHSYSPGLLLRHLVVLDDARSSWRANSSFNTRRCGAGRPPSRTLPRWPTRCAWRLRSAATRYRRGEAAVSAARASRRLGSGRWASS